MPSPDFFPPDVPYDSKWLEYNNYSTMTDLDEEINVLDNQCDVQLSEHPPSDHDYASQEKVWTDVRRRKAAKRDRDSDSGDSSVSTQTVRGPLVEKKERIPPIIIEGVARWQAFLRNLRQCGFVFEAKFVGDAIHVRCDSSGRFRELQTHLKQQKICFHTFQLKSERELKVALRGLRHDTPPEDIIEDLQSEGFTPTAATILSRNEGGGKKPTNTFLVRLRKVGSWGKIWDLRKLLGVAIRVEEFHPKPGLPQCYRCQNFGHASFNCNLPVRCVKCAGNHYGRECPLPPSHEPQCCNCNGQHVASWRGCPAHQEALAKKRGASRQPPTKDRPARASTQAAPPRPAPRSLAPPSRPPPSQEAFPPLAGTMPPPKPPGHPPTFSEALKRPVKKKTNKPAPPPVTETETELESEMEASSVTEGNTSDAAYHNQRPRRRKQVRRPTQRPRIPTEATKKEGTTSLPSAEPRRNVTLGPASHYHAPAESISVDVLLKWMTSIIPILLVPGNRSPTEVLAAVLESLQDLLRNGRTN